ncbi:MAG: DUF507 family protein [Deltaproteobacteria bacterium]|nr:DUF507 family protein [Deltaproteobacteria bacterium]
MRIYPKVVPAMAREIVKALMGPGHIEVESENVAAAEDDLVAIVREYQRQEDSMNRQAKDLVVKRGWPSHKFAEARSMVVQAKRFPMGDDGIDYMIEQMMEFMLITNNIEEVYAQDNVLRKIIVTIMRRFGKMDEEVDTEARGRLKHLQEGTRDWEVQYQKVSDQVRRNKGLI